MTEEREHQPIKGPRVAKGLLIVDTGPSRGKTAAALGVLLRAWGRGMRVRMLEFVASEPRGEHRAAAAWDIDVERVPDGPTEADRARAAWPHAREAVVAGDADVVVLDDLALALARGWLSVEPVLEALAARPPLRHVIVTGEDAPPSLVAAADLVTEMRVVKDTRPSPRMSRPGINH